MASQADPETIALIRRLAAAAGSVRPTKGAQYELLAYRLRGADVCDAIVNWIDAGERVKPTALHSIPGRIGQAAYEMKPRFDGRRFYIKVVIDDRGGAQECLVLLSVHPDR